MFAGEDIVIVGEVFPLIPSRISTSARDNVVVTFGLTIEVVGVLIVRFVVEGDTTTAIAFRLTSVPMHSTLLNFRKTTVGVSSSLHLQAGHSQTKASSKITSIQASCHTVSSVHLGDRMVT